MDKVFAKSTSDENIEEFLNNLDVSEESMYDDADALVKPMSLSADTDIKTVTEEIKKGNIVLLNIGDMQKRNAGQLKEMIGRVKEAAHSINGDIARISSDRVLVTPQNVKIIKRRGE